MIAFAHKFYYNSEYVSLGDGSAGGEGGAGLGALLGALSKLYI